MKRFTVPQTAFTVIRGESGCKNAKWSTQVLTNKYEGVKAKKKEKLSEERRGQN